MDKKVFKSGDIITPDFLNELQNLSFEKSPDEVGGLPVFVILVDSEDADAANYPYLMDKFIAAGKTADNSYGQDVGFDVVETRGGHRIIGIIENKAVTTDKLADDAVTKEKIARGAVSNGCLADKSVSTEKIIDGNVTTDKIAAGAVVRDKLADDVVGANQLDDTESYNMAGLSITGPNKSVTMKEQSQPGASQGIVMADGVIDHGYQLLRATTATYDLTSAHGSGDDSNLTHIVAIYNAYSGQCTVTIDSPTGGEAPKTVLLNSGNVGLFMKIGGNGTTPVFAPVSFSRTVSS